MVRAKELCSQGLKNREIADTLGIPLATVKRYLAE
ncbi:MAG TPA: winged helix-turn-helix transcriptional regulator [Verrucomicrobia bacterium]|nr:winged helix-turn-helix transcriptional regulator [Verrucomicrobiota bacterium]